MPETPLETHEVDHIGSDGVLATEAMAVQLLVA